MLGLGRRDVMHVLSQAKDHARRGPAALDDGRLAPAASRMHTDAVYSVREIDVSRVG